MADEGNDTTAGDLTAGMSGGSNSAIGAALADAVQWIGEGIEGVGEGRTAAGEPCIVVFVSALDPDRRAAIPTTHAGFDVVLDDTDTIHALDDDN